MKNWWIGSTPAFNPRRRCRQDLEWQNANSALHPPHQHVSAGTTVLGRVLAAPLRDVPGDGSQIIYVWLDALTNYLSGLGYGTGEEHVEFWAEDALKIHVLGKDVWKFHAVYWPAFLLSAGLPLPDVVLVHGFLTVNGRKISKTTRDITSGDIVDPFLYVRRYGADAVRYYLLRAVQPFEDAFAGSGLD